MIWSPSLLVRVKNAIFTRCFILSRTLLELVEPDHFLNSCIQTVAEPRSWMLRSESEYEKLLETEVPKFQKRKFQRVSPSALPLSYPTFSIMLTAFQIVVIRFLE